jgi:hypothetical protein
MIHSGQKRNGVSDAALTSPSVQCVKFQCVRCHGNWDSTDNCMNEQSVLRLIYFCGERIVN